MCSFNKLCKEKCTKIKERNKYENNGKKTKMKLRHPHEAATISGNYEEMQEAGSGKREARGNTTITV